MIHFFGNDFGFKSNNKGKFIEVKLNKPLLQRLNGTV